MKRKKLTINIYNVLSLKNVKNKNLFLHDLEVNAIEHLVYKDQSNIFNITEDISDIVS